MNNENNEILKNINAVPSENSEENYTIPNETCCSAEFPQGCISGE